MGAMVNLLRVKIIENVNISKKKKWNTNILVKHVQNAVAQWFSKQGVMVNLKHVQIIRNVNILKTLEKGRTSYDR